MSFALEEIQFVGRAEILKASGGVRDFVESLESSASSLGSSYFLWSLSFPVCPLGPSAYILTTPLSQQGPSTVAGLSMDGAGESENDLCIVLDGFDTFEIED